MSRRAFVAGATAAAVLGPGAVTAVAQPLPAKTTTAAATDLRRAAGVALLAGEPAALCLSDAGWVLVGDDGATRATAGLEGADVLSMSADGRGALAAGQSAGQGVLWHTTDGALWREVLRLPDHSMLTAVGAGVALGSRLTGEGVPRGTVVAHRRGGRWATEPASGLSGTAEASVTAVAAGPGGWLAAAVGSRESVLYRSADGAVWTRLPDGQLPDAAVRGLLGDDGEVRWVANAFGGSAAVAGVVGAGRGPVAVAQEAHAVGFIRTRRGRSSYWLSEGRLRAVEVR